MPFRFADYQLGSPKPYYIDHPLTFGSDLDCALYILQDPGKSNAHDRILRTVREHTGSTEWEILSLGKEVKERIAGLAKARRPGECLYVKASSLAELVR